MLMLWILLEIIHPKHRYIGMTWHRTVAVVLEERRSALAGAEALLSEAYTALALEYAEPRVVTPATWVALLPVAERLTILGIKLKPDLKINCDAAIGLSVLTCRATLNWLVPLPNVDTHKMLRICGMGAKADAVLLGLTICGNLEVPMALAEFPMCEVVALRIQVMALG